MADVALAPRSPLAHSVVPGRHGRAEGEAGVSLTIVDSLSLTMLLLRRGSAEKFRAAVSAVGWRVPDRNSFEAIGDVTLLWSGPDQILIATEPQGSGAARQFVEARAGFSAVAEQSDARAVIDVAGPKARATLAKGFPIDLHPRAFKPGSTALTTAAGVALQIWQLDAIPTYRIAVPRSCAEGFWRWLVHAAAEFGVTVTAPD